MARENRGTHCNEANTFSFASATLLIAWSILPVPDPSPHGANATISCLERYWLMDMRPNCGQETNWISLAPKTMRLWKVWSIIAWPISEMMEGGISDLTTLALDGDFTLIDIHPPEVSKKGTLHGTRACGWLAVLPTSRRIQMGVSSHCGMTFSTLAGSKYVPNRRLMLTCFNLSSAVCTVVPYIAAFAFRKKLMVLQTKGSVALHSI